MVSSKALRPPGRTLALGTRAVLRGTLAMLVLGVLTATHPPPSTPLLDTIDRIIRNHRATAAQWGIYVQDVRTGQVLVARNSDKTMVPASNQKILTAAVALDALGSNFRYETTLYFTGTVEGHTMRGDLIVEGSGDPTFGSRQVTGEDPLKLWAEALVEMGVRRFEGRLIGDDNIFDDTRYPSSWKAAAVARQSYAPATSGLSYNDNLVRLSLRAGVPDAPLRVTGSPAGYLRVQNKATTRPQSRGRNLNLNRIPGTETVRLTGWVNKYYRAGVAIPVYNPTALTLHSFAQHLRAAGIETRADMVDIDDLGGEAVQKQMPLFVHVSPPLSEILAVLNKESDNFFAEHVFRTFSWGGSLEGGALRAKAFMEGAGIPVGGLHIADGSGLSHDNRITPEAMVKVLAVMYEHPERNAFLASLARGGERQTTLQSRLQKVPVQAKTGSLNRIRTLSGLATTRDGRVVAFAIFANDYRTYTSRVLRAIDDIVRTLTALEAG